VSNKFESNVGAWAAGFPEPRLGSLPSEGIRNSSGNFEDFCFQRLGANLQNFVLAAKAQYVQGGLMETLVLTQNSFSITCKSVRRCHKPINLQAFLCNIVLIALQRRARSVAQLNCRLFC
jgi:hypothetical protein